MDLIRITLDDAEILWKMQVEAFQDLYTKYQDTESSPATEKNNKIIMRLKQSFTYYYFINVDGVNVGAIRVVDKKEAGKVEKINDKLTLVFYKKD